ncbi:glycosyltransferase [Kitasatospora sp. NBC_00085]|uniref:glycosyltransferase n=1 Tax=unclassified Kitasatospora TaxID=2633591 RepID=UPI00324B597F
MTPDTSADPIADPPAAQQAPTVVLLLRHFTVGGLERVLLSHVRILIEAGYRVTVCVLEPGRGNVLVAELLSEARLVVAPRARLRRLAFLERLVRDTTVLMQLGDGRLYPSIRPALRNARTVVRFCHSDYSHNRTRRRNLLDRALSRGEDYIVAVGGRSTRFLLDDVGVAAGKVRTLTNAVEPRSAPAEPPSWEWSRDRYFVAIQSLYPHKGHDALLRAFAQAAARTDEVIRLVVIGEGDQNIPLYLLANQLGVADRVVWLGAVWRRDLVDSVLAGAVGFVSMSRYEGVPISVLEARQHGLPLVLTDIPGHRDGAGTSPAVFTAVDDVDAFAAELLTVLQASAEPDARRHVDGTILTEEWERYRQGFLDIVAEAGGVRPTRPAAGRAAR